MVRTKRIKYQKRKVYRRTTRGGQPPNKPLPPLPKPPLLPSSKPLKPLPELPKSRPKLLPIVEHVSPHPPSPLFRRHSHSHSPPKSRKPSFFRKKRGTYTRKTPYGKAKQLLEKLADDQKSISAIFARGSHGVDDAALERELKQYEPEPKH